MKSNRPQPEDPKHLRVFAYILEYKARHDGNSPSFEEIMDACDVSSKSVTFFYLNKLEAEGYIRRPLPSRHCRRSACTIEVVGGNWEYSGIKIPSYVPSVPLTEDEVEFVFLSNRLAAAMIDDPYGQPAPAINMQLETIISAQRLPSILSQE